jgi:hypothetical protein
MIYFMTIKTTYAAKATFSMIVKVICALMMIFFTMVKEIFAAQMTYIMTVKVTFVYQAKYS